MIIIVQHLPSRTRRSESLFFIIIIFFFKSELVEIQTIKRNVVFGTYLFINLNTI